MTLDLALVVQEAFKVLRDDAEKVSQTSVLVKNQKIRVEEIARMLLEHLCELNIIDINLDSLTQTGWEQAGKFADYATRSLPANQAERLALELKELDQDTLEKIVDYLDADTRRRVLIVMGIE